MTETSEFPLRPLPALTKDTEAFWTGGKDGQLLIEQCDRCAYYIHPPTGFCPQCESRDTHFHPVSGKGRLLSFSINHRKWMPELPERYVLGIVTLAEQEEVRLVCNVVNCDPDAVEFDMPVKVLFEEQDGCWVPLFEPDGDAT